MRAVIGLGSNLGDRAATLRAAVDALGRVACVVAKSRIYETAPVGGPPQPAYLNAAVLVSSNGSARALFRAMQAIEASLGRTRTVRWGPRTIDLDLLWIDGVIVDEPDLVVPHPRLAERAFALAPLRDVAPDARDPRTGAPFAAATGDLRVFGEAL